MPSLVMAVVFDDGQLIPVLEAWQEAGARAPIALDSVCAVPEQSSAGARDDLPLFPSLREIAQRCQLHSKTVLAVAQDDAQVEALVAATRRVLGELDSQKTGYVLVSPLSRVEGLRLPGT